MTRLCWAEVFLEKLPISGACFVYSTFEHWTSEVETMRFRTDTNYIGKTLSEPFVMGLLEIRSSIAITIRVYNPDTGKMITSRMA